MTRTILTSLSLCFLFSTGTAQQAIGQWKEQLSFREISAIDVSGEKIFCASGEGLFIYDRDTYEIERYTKVNGLSDVGVSQLAYAESIGSLVVGYSSGNVDIISGSEIINLPDILNSQIIGDKGIYDIEIKGERAWLGCGFGIVVIDIVTIEVVDTYLIGENGGNLKVNDILIEEDTVYAATGKGILIGNLASNLADFSEWETLVQDLPYPNDEYKVILRFGSKIITFNTGESTAIYAFENDVWSQVEGTEDDNPQHISVNQERMLITNRNYLQIRNQELGFLGNYSTYPFDNWLSLNTALITPEGEYLIGDEDHGLVIAQGEIGEEVEVIVPESPYVNVAWSAAAYNGELWVAHGRLKANFDNDFSGDGFSGFSNGQWIQGAKDPIFETVKDIVDVQLDPNDPDKVHFASFYNGLLTYSKSNQTYLLQNIIEGNSPIDTSQQNSERVHVSSLEYDINGNLWVTNSITPEGWKILKTDGTWASMGCAQLSPTTLYGEMVITEAGQTWTILPRSNGAVVLDHGNEIINTSSHPCKIISTQIGSGGLPTDQTYCIAEDLDGEIWLGTSEGPVVNYSPQSIMSNNPIDFQPILVERDGNVERLLGSESITAIEVDGANRKWLGTLSGGIFLLSEDGTEEIHHFTVKNSPLYSNVIVDIAIDPITGAVHIGTEAGLITYMGDATLGVEENECYDVYPNPVRPDYYGPVTIDGLKAESEVKITDVAGNIVFQMDSNGGRAVWQGTDFSGNRVSTGVYFALVSDREGESTCISKILFIN